MSVKIRPYAAEQLREFGCETIEDIKLDSFNDSAFFSWLFDDDSLYGYDYDDLTEEQAEAFNELLSTF